MQNLPEKVANTFAGLREQYKFLIVLRRVSDHFYVYKASSHWDKNEKKVKSSQEYLGRITKDGAFIRKRASQTEMELDRAKALIEANGGTINFIKRIPRNSAVRIKADEIDKEILMFLSMNARAPVPFIAKSIGLSVSATQYRIKRLESKYGIKYLLELDLSKLGYSPYLTFIKFEGATPSLEELKAPIINEPKIQFAATIRGDYDLLVYTVDRDLLHVIDNFYSFITTTNLGKYGAKWNVIPFATVYSFMPTTQTFVETVIGNNVWRRSKESLAPTGEQVTHREYIVLKELNGNAKENFSVIDAKYGFDKGTARYIYHKLKSKGIIVRPTISITGIPIKYTGMIMIADINWELILQNRHKLLADIVEFGTISNVHSLVGNIGLPIGAVAFSPVLIDGPELDDIATKIETDLGGGSVVRSSVITAVLTGELCYRRFDMTYTRQYRLLLQMKKIRPMKIIDYEPQ